MPEPSRRLTLAGDPPGNRRRKGPGAGVVLIGLYALLFGGALWTIRERIPLLHRRAGAGGSLPKRPAAPSPRTRAELVAAATLPLVARDAYFRALSAECCPCGCDMTLRECLVSDPKCVVSSERAERLFEEMH